MKTSHLPTFLRTLGVVVLVAGLAGAGLVYVLAKNQSSNAIGYAQGDGTMYPIMPEDSKMYQRDLEMYGGKAALLMDDFRRWFASLWHGTTLAFTIGCITIVVSLGIFFVANRL